MKRAFSLWYTLVFLIVMAIVGTMIMEFSSSTTHHSARSFLDTKAELILRSATEFAIMALEARDYRKYGKINQITINYPGFTAKVKFQYFATNCDVNDTNCYLINTKETNMSVLIFVSVENPSFHIRKTKITLQNP